jgi:RNA polymerase sigma factor (sigma-70 family)
MVLRVCRRILHDAHESEDAFQAVFLILARKAHTIRQHQSVASWLYKVAYHVAVRARAGAARREEVAARAPRPKAVDPFAEVTGRELLSVLDDELQRLPEKYRAPLLLCYLEGYTQDEAARQLGWSSQVLRGRIDRGRAVLRRRLSRRGFGPSAVAAGTLLDQAPAAVPALLTAQTLRTVMGSFHAPATAVSIHIAALAEAATKALAATKLKVAVSVVLIMGVLVAGLGAGLSSFRAPEPQSPSTTPAAEPPAAQAKSEPRRDRYGDLLPPGALGRLGTVRFRRSNSGYLHYLAFSPDETQLACTDSDGVRVYKTTSGRPIRLFADRADVFAFLHGGRRILTGGENLIIWDTVNGKEIKRLPVKGGWFRFSISPDGKMLADRGSGGAILLMDAATGAVLRQLDGPGDQMNPRPKGARSPGGESRSVTFSPDGKALASACVEDKHVFLWDTATGKVRHTLPGHDKPNVVRFSPDGRLLAVGGEDSKIHLWDAATGRELQQLRGHVGPIYGLAFSPDSMMLASGAGSSAPSALAHPPEDAVIRLWDLKTGKCRPLLGPPGLASSLAFSPDGKLLAVGGGGTSIYLIDIATGKRQQQYIGHEGRIFRVALSPDGSTLASGGEDNLIYLWDAKTSQKKLCWKDIGTTSAASPSRRMGASYFRAATMGTCASGIGAAAKRRAALPKRTTGTTRSISRRMARRSSCRRESFGTSLRGSRAALCRTSKGFSLALCFLRTARGWRCREERLPLSWMFKQGKRFVALPDMSLEKMNHGASPSFASHSHPMAAGPCRAAPKAWPSSGTRKPARCSGACKDTKTRFSTWPSPRTDVWWRQLAAIGLITRTERFAFGKRRRAKSVAASLAIKTW